jgi:tetratricopeptide (TPR) repeat protein
MALKHLEKIYAMQKDISVSMLITLYPQLLGQIHLDLGNTANALSYGEEALALSIKGNSRDTEGVSKILLGGILCKSDASKAEEAERNMLQGIKILEELKLRPAASHGYLRLGELYSDIGKQDKALEWLKKAEAEFQNMGMDYWLSFDKSLIAKTLVKIDPSQFNQCEQTILDAIKIAQDIESRPALAFGHLCLGEIYADDGQKEKALENLKKAEAMYQEMGMGLWLGKIREILKRLI